MPCDDGAAADRLRPAAQAQPRADADSDARGHPGPDAHSHAGTHTDAYSHSDPDSDADAHSCPDSDADPGCDPRPRGAAARDHQEPPRGDRGQGRQLLVYGKGRQLPEPGLALCEPGRPDRPDRRRRAGSAPRNGDPECDHAQPAAEEHPLLGKRLARVLPLHQRRGL